MIIQTIDDALIHPALFRKRGARSGRQGACCPHSRCPRPWQSFCHVRNRWAPRHLVVAPLLLGSPPPWSWMGQ
eukprot:2996725-Lingulodinium_polyedra.AAC.1